MRRYFPLEGNAQDLSGNNIHGTLVNGVAFSSASDAASAIAGHRTNGWAFFLTDQASRRSLRAVRRDYVSKMAVDVEDDEPDDEDEDDEGFSN